MKKFLAIAAVAAMILSLGSCKKDEPTNYKFADDALADLMMYEGGSYDFIEVGSDMPLPAIEGYTYQDGDEALFTATSDDEEVVSVIVSDAGDIIFKALKKGEAMITVTFEKGKINLSKSFYVTVKADELYLYFGAESTMEFGSEAYCTLCWRSGKELTETVTYAVYLNDQKLEDGVCSHVAATGGIYLEANLPGQYRIEATYDSEKYEQTVTVAMPDTYNGTFTPCYEPIMDYAWLDLDLDIESVSGRTVIYTDGAITSDTVISDTGTFSYDKLWMGNGTPDTTFWATKGTTVTKTISFGFRNGYFCTSKSLDGVYQLADLAALLAGDNTTNVYSNFMINGQEYGTPAGYAAAHALLTLPYAYEWAMPDNDHVTLRVCWVCGAANSSGASFMIYDLTSTWKTTQHV